MHSDEEGNKALSGQRKRDPGHLLSVSLARKRKRSGSAKGLFPDPKKFLLAIT
jgi:hypothetical protein